MPSPACRTALSAAVISIAFVAGLGGCAADPLADSSQSTGPIACTEPRPQVCTMIYAPVCAEHRDGHRETHASDCNACADDTVVAHSAGPCEPLASTVGAL